ncbi:MAG: hypothetical protein EZS28_041006, partial [Streblomastix strix]
MEEMPGNSNPLKNIKKRNEIEPIILVPGLAGSHIDFKYKHSPTQDLTQLWIDALRLITEPSQFIHDVQPKYIIKNDTYESADHIEAIVTDFGGIKGIDVLDKNFPDIANGPFSGASVAFFYLATPRRWVIPTLSPEQANQLVSSMGGVYWMLNSQNIFDPDMPVAKIVKRKDNSTDEELLEIISVKNLSWAFSSTNRPSQLAATQNIEKQINEMPNPCVPTFIMYGSGIDTSKEAKYFEEEEENNEEIYV